ncbi:RICIN domain-containing protein [Frigoriglobus tundricola]|uniref:Ricin B lectin domain-containing protein n=1 Tax=Frigoriglobus tundricola TaxID=2774151 RepID=A0A6M5YMC6_9BACT|nr:RICIN domain-containing protein [Frigoriglobus tundricola]QJW94500.1 hypothetical protein FTUN_2021 [Frigoriglobus tundricola]
MRQVFALVFLLAAVFLARPAGAEPDRTEALARAKAKFELDIEKAEKALAESLDRAEKKARDAGKKADVDKLLYERDLFNAQRIPPTVIASAAYLKQRAQAVAALEAVYLPAIKELSKAKKGDEAEALETALSDLLKTARGYGLAVPELALHPQLLIENKASGQVLEAAKDGQGELYLAAKVGKKKPGQCWYLERDETGYTVKNVQSGRCLQVGNGFSAGTAKFDPKRDAADRVLFEVTEVRREVLIVSQVKSGLNGYVLTVVEKKQKGVTTYELQMDRKDAPPAPNQLWTLTEAKP